MVPIVGTLTTIAVFVAAIDLDEAIDLGMIEPTVTGSAGAAAAILTRPDDLTGGIGLVVTGRTIRADDLPLSRTGGSRIAI